MHFLALLKISKNERNWSLKFIFRMRTVFTYYNKKNSLFPRFSTSLSHLLNQVFARIRFWLGRIYILEHRHDPKKIPSINNQTLHFTVLFELKLRHSTARSLPYDLSQYCDLLNNHRQMFDKYFYYIAIDYACILSL